ncbi:MAG TPA: endonuclease/exonuclease/phosphatase family protein [Chloroflexota bacterium]|nr:endonuclease/exonuclease/phosphatase family protein [Chloroflexota bacterium]
MTLKVLSYNIREGGDDRLHGIAAIIRKQQPDAVALLEATSRAHALTLARDLRMQLAFGEANNGIHVAWLSRLPIQRTENHRLAALAKTLLEIEVVWQDAPLRLFATHLASRWGDHSPCYSRELLRLRTPQRATLAPEGSIQAHFADRRARHMATTAQALLSPQGCTAILLYAPLPCQNRTGA